MNSQCLSIRSRVDTFRSRGVETSFQAASPTPSMLVFLCPKSARMMSAIPLSREGSEYKTPQGEISSRSLGAVSNLPAPLTFEGGNFEAKSKVATMPNTSTLKRYRAVSIRTRNTFTVMANSFACARALLPADAAITCRSAVSLSTEALEVIV